MTTTRLATTPTEPPLVPAVVRAVALMDTLARQRSPMSMAQLASTLSLPRSSVHGLCGTLVSLGLLRRQADGQLLIGPRVMGLAQAFVSSTDVAREFDALWQASAQPPEETVVLSVLDGADVVYLATRNGSRLLGLAFSVGMRLPAHIAATGRAMLAYSDSAWVRQHFATDALMAELAASHARGYAIDDEGIRLGVYGIAAPVLDATGRPVAGVGLCLNKAMLDHDGNAAHQQRQWVQDIARALSQRLGGDLPAPAAGPAHQPRPHHP
jgi:DNA-binding IclR family transcriptional regulator